MAGACGFPRGGDADFVLQFDDDSLGSFFSDALDARKCGGVAGDDGGLECGDGGAAEHVERGFRAYAADVLHEQSEKVALGRRHESEKNMRVFADGEVCEDFDLRAGSRQLVVAGKWNEHVIPNAANIQNDLRGQGFDERAVEVVDHAPCVSRQMHACQMTNCSRWFFSRWRRCSW